MLLETYVATSAALGWFLAQGIKTCIAVARQRRFNWREALFGTGDTPSSHCAFVSSLSAAVLISQGPSLAFLLALALSVLTIRDALGVRHEVGRHAQVLNQLTATLQIPAQPLSVKVGHQPLDVGLGVAVGLLAAVLVAQIPLFHEVLQ